MTEKQALQGLEKISQTIGKLPDMVQGGGGNTSAKINEKIMAIKASGFKLTQITENKGYAPVNYQNLIKYFKKVDTSRDIDYEKEYSEKIMENVVSGEKVKPSVETGFHSFLKKYVIHTHSVYANIPCCVKNGRNLIDQIFAGEEIEPLWIKYTHPGFDLTKELMGCLQEYCEEFGYDPEVIFLENHGLIITTEQAEDCIALNTKVNQILRNHLNIKDEYPEVGIEEIKDQKFVSKTQYLIDFFKGIDIKEDYFKNILYPDQIVYLEDDVAINSKDKDSKININADNGEIIYKTKYNEAKTIDETLTAFIYIMDYIENSDLTLQTMPQKYIDLIKNMQAEKHRKKVMKEEDD